ncbi:MAG: rod shape-determining protein RodA [Kofleriaceae bacterium]
MKGTGLLLPRATIGVSRWRRFRAAVDWPLIITMVAICTLGLLNLYSATRVVPAKFDSQVKWMVVGVIAFAVVTIVDYRAMVRLAWVGIGIAIGLLVLARLLGAAGEDDRHGATYRWIFIAGMRLQPSELTQVLTILVLARILQDAEALRQSARKFLLGLAVLAIPIVLIAIQPDLGTATLVVLIVLTVGFIAMPSVWPMVYITVAGLLAIPILWERMHDYQKNRILSFIDCSAAQTTTCWHTQQSIFAVGSGQIWGKGYMGGTQNQFNFVPEHWTDFPFSVWAEEWGFAGSAFVLGLFAFLLVWILNVAFTAKDRIGAVVCIGVAAMTFWHLVVNVGMVLGVAPVVGVTLPFMSYGGSSLVTFFIGMGLVANVSLRKHGY